MDTGIGAKLRSARNRRKVELAEVERATKIRLRYLEAMETEEWDALPGGAYRIGFIRTYASYLGLDGRRLAEEYRVASGEPRPGEKGAPRADPVVASGPPPRRRGIARGLLAVVLVLALIAVLAVVGSSGGERKGTGGATAPAEGEAPAVPQEPGPGEPATATRETEGVSVRLAAEAEVWVCLVDRSGAELIDGQVLVAGAEEGPFRSGSFTVSFGNGEVSMWIDGRQASIPATSGPIGYEIGADGSLTPLPEAERPTCV